VLKQPHRRARWCLAREGDEVRFDGANIRHLERDLTAKVHEANAHIVVGVELGLKEAYLRFETTDTTGCRVVPRVLQPPLGPVPSAASSSLDCEWLGPCAVDWLAL